MSCCVLESDLAVCTLVNVPTFSSATRVPRTSISLAELSTWTLLLLKMCVVHQGLSQQQQTFWNTETPWNRKQTLLSLLSGQRNNASYCDAAPGCAVTVWIDLSKRQTIFWSVPKTRLVRLPETQGFFGVELDAILYLDLIDIVWYCWLELALYPDFLPSLCQRMSCSHVFVVQVSAMFLCVTECPLHLAQQVHY